MLKRERERKRKGIIQDIRFILGIREVSKEIGLRKAGKQRVRNFTLEEKDIQVKIKRERYFKYKRQEVRM